MDDGHRILYRDRGSSLASVAHEGVSKIRGLNTDPKIVGLSLCRYPEFVKKQPHL